MPSVLDDLVSLLSLERISENAFSGQSQDLGWGSIFGGQVLGQALAAATQTVAHDRPVHSLHAYFLRRGDAAKPISYEVDRIRDGFSFTTRGVVALQSGKAIFNMAASFQQAENGFEHHEPMPEAPDPEALPTERERMAPHVSRLHPALQERALCERPLELRPTDPVDDPFRPSPSRPRRMVWIRSSGRLADDPALHRYLLAYASDFAFLTTALLPHGVTWLTPEVRVASLDHAMWFYAPFRCDDWLLHVMESPVAFGSRGLVRGNIFTRDGKLVASTSQEGLIRLRKPLT